MLDEYFEYKMKCMIKPYMIKMNDLNILNFYIKLVNENFGRKSDNLYYKKIAQ